jgi:excisionase family DNA binding protein
MDAMRTTLRELESWLPTHKVAQVLGVSRNTATKLIAEGHIRGVRTQLGWLADPHSVEDYHRRKK